MQDKSLDNLMILVIEVLVKRSYADLSMSIPFIEVFTEACIKQKLTMNAFIQTNPRTRDQIRENPIGNKYIIDDHEDVESVFVTQKAIDKVLLLV